MSTVLAPAQLLTHDVGVSETPSRRRFTASYKREILRAAERCTAPGEIAALLRREGLYSSHLATWRKAEREGHLAGAAPRRGPVPDAPEVRAAKDAEAAVAKRIAELERELKRATARAERAEALVEAQKKVAALLDHLLPPKDDEPGGSTGKR